MGLIKICSKIPFHTHYTPLLPSGRIISVPLPIKRSFYKEKNQGRFVDTFAFNQSSSYITRNIIVQFGV